MNRCSARLQLLTVVGVAATLAALVAACSSGSGSGGSSQNDAKALEGKAWVASEIGGKAVIDSSAAVEVTAEFAAGKVSGSGGVNRYSATCTTTSDGGITVAQVAATQMAGPPAAMDQEQAYFSALSHATSFSVSGDTLTLSDGQGAVVVRYKAVQPIALQGTEWKALAYNNGKGGLQSIVAGSAITATFAADGALTGSATINSYSTSYTTGSGGAMTIDGAIRTNMMSGPKKLVRQELAYLAALPKTATYSIEADELWLRDAGGAALAHYVAR